jgi:glucokinase-like ROK family protein
MEKGSTRIAARSLVGSATQGEIMRRVRGYGRPVSRAQLTEHLGVSRSKVSLEVGQLVEAGLLVEDGLGESEGGRRSSLLRIPRGAGLVAAVDLGATSADVAITTLGGEVIGRTGEPADIREGPNRVLGRAVELLAELLDEQGADAREVVAVGVGLPGPVEYASGRPTVPPLMPGWDSYPIHEAFAGWYDAPVFVDNDVNIMALGEHRGGLGRGVENMLFVKIGTGIGCGIVVDGRLYRGSQGSAGDIGHVRAAPDGPVCACGNVACLEAMAAAPAIVREAERIAGLEPGGALAALREAEELDLGSVLKAATHGDAGAVGIVRRSGRLIGETLATLVSVLNPSLVVIGGGVAYAANHTLLAEIRSAIYHRSLPLATRNLPIMLSELGEDAGVVGASVMAAEGVLEVRA